MELTSDLITVQGLLLSAVKSTGDFTKILHKGGNEMKITEIIKQLEGFLESKNYLDKRKCNEAHRKELESIVFFLILNSQFDEKAKIDLAKYFRLVNIIPQLSQCLLANIVVELGLVEPYCDALHLMPVHLWTSLLVEMLHCVKKSVPELSIRYTYVFVKNIIVKIGSIDAESSKTREIIDSLEDIIKQLLLNCSSITLEVAQEIKKTRIYKLMGLSLLRLLKLLQCCQVENQSLIGVIGNLINICTGIVQAVTIDVFCTWAEVEFKGSPLQISIGEEAYQVIEKYQKFKPAKELMQMLASISKKPLTLSEQIQRADTATIVRKINEDFENRKRWFKALLNPDVFSNADAAECLKKYSHLCTLEDVYYLLSTLLHCKNQENIDLFMKCASCLNNSELTTLLIRHYHNHGLKNNLGGDGKVINQLIYILNKWDSKSDEVNPDVLLLLICEPKSVLKHLYKECIKSNMITDSLKETFKGISGFIEIEGLFLMVLTELLEEIKPDGDNLENYKKLLEVISEKTSACNKIINVILEPKCSKYLGDKEFESLRSMLTLYTSIVKNSSEEETRKLLHFCCSTLETCRWIIFDFANVKVDLCQLAVDCLSSYRDSNLFPIGLSSAHPLNNYYLSKAQNEAEFFNHFVPKFPNDRTEVITWLLRILPLCLIGEWSGITRQFIETFGANLALGFYADALILISELVKTQSQEGSVSIRNGLKYCIQNYGFIVKNVFVTLNEETVDVEIAKNVCKLLNYLPKDMEAVEGMSLAGIIPSRALKSLASDKDFVDALRSLAYPKIAASIVRRMLN